MVRPDFPDFASVSHEANFLDGFLMPNLWKQSTDDPERLTEAHAPSAS
jgi:hypothetical protein